MWHLYFFAQKLPNPLTRSAIETLSVTRFPDDILAFPHADECPAMAKEIEHSLAKVSGDQGAIEAFHNSIGIWQKRVVSAICFS
jgi:hypothetical protein